MRDMKTDLVWTPIRIKLSQIIPWEDNPRMSTKEEAELLIKSERELGQPQTLAISPFVDKNKVHLYDGHQRYKAWNTAYDGNYIVWAMQSNRQLTTKERKKISVLLHTATGKFNFEVLNTWDKQDLKDWGMETAITGMGTQFESLQEMFEGEKVEIKSKDAEVDIDLGAKYAKKWKVKYGSVYQVGRHRVMCGDALMDVDVKILMDEVQADIVFSDIPYGIDYLGGRTQIIKHKPYGKILGDAEKDVSRFVPPLIELGAKDLWCCCSPINLAPALRPFDEVGGVNAIVVWDKRQPGLGYQWIRRQCEFIIFTSTREKSHEESSEFDLWSISRDRGEDYVHGTQKPVSLAVRALELSKPCGKNVVDLYAGSGSTVVACENLGMNCFAMDLDKNFVGVILERMHLAFPKLKIEKIN